jgi:hypothetical protein
LAFRDFLNPEKGESKAGREAALLLFPGFLFARRASMFKESATVDITPEMFLAQIIENAIAQFRLVTNDSTVATVPSGPLSAPVATTDGQLRGGHNGQMKKLSASDRQRILRLKNEHGLSPVQIAGRFGGVSPQAVRRVLWEEENEG